MSRSDRQRSRDLMEAIAAYDLLLDEIGTVARPRQENPETVAYLGGIIERAAARARERECEQGETAP